MVAGWLDSAQAEPAGKKERCIACAHGRASLWCKQCKSFFHAQCIPGFDYKDAEVIWCPSCMAERDTEELSQLDTCTLCSSELPGGGSAWHVMSSCSHTGLQAQRERMAGPFAEVVKATIKELELDRGEWGHREEVSEAFRRTPTGTWVAPAGWTGKGGPMDGTVTNPWYRLFPPVWVDGSSTGEGDGHRSGEL